MTIPEAEKYFNSLNKEQRQRYNLLVSVGRNFGKSFEEAYDYAKTVIEEQR